MLIIDRFEENWAIIEAQLRETPNKVIFKLPRSILPDGLKEGDCLDIIIKKNEAATELRKNQASVLLHKLTNNKKEEDSLG